jgi:FtsP/CotA-like multicopper oxidase with cupredoxin domain
VGIPLGSGLVGALIIRGDIDEVPAIQAAKERILVLQQLPYMLIDDPYAPGTQANRVENFFQLIEVSWASLVAQGRRVTINGEVEPTFTMQPGEVQRLGDGTPRVSTPAPFARVHEKQGKPVSDSG